MADDLGAVIQNGMEKCSVPPENVRPLYRVDNVDGDNLEKFRTVSLVAGKKIRRLSVKVSNLVMLVMLMARRRAPGDFRNILHAVVECGRHNKFSMEEGEPSDNALKKFCIHFLHHGHHRCEA